jgi:hypothetical protein
MRTTAGYRKAYRGNKTFLQTDIGELRKSYGADFAEGCADDEKIPDVLRKLPSLRQVIREHEAKLFEEF